MFLLRNIVSESGAKHTVLIAKDSEERLIERLDKMPDDIVESYFITDTLPDGVLKSLTQ